MLPKSGLCLLLVAAAATCTVWTEGGPWFLPGAEASWAGTRVGREAPSTNGTSNSALRCLVDAFGSGGRMTTDQLQAFVEEIDAECTSVEELLRDHGLTGENLQNDTEATLNEICPSLLYKTALDECEEASTTEATLASDPEEPTIGQVWGYGLLCVTIINCGSLMGAFVIPCMDKRVYKLILTYLVGLAVGTLTGSALLHLIPKTHGLKVKKLGNDLVWKNCAILLGIYLFFFAERMLKMMTSKADSKREAKRQKSIMHVSGMNSSAADGYKITSGDSALQLTESLEVNTPDEKDGNEHSHGELVDADGKVRVASVAYMIVCGDGLHNFVDGLAIGASFTTSLLNGFSTSIAIACEEFPHELGDFAVLLKSGLSVKQAMGFNFLSSLTCYAGLVVGIIVGRLTAAEPYIFALAAGMFLYIALVDMLPEIANVASKSKFRLGSEMGIFVLQNAGILTGFGIMILLSVLHPYIKIKAA